MAATPPPEKDPRYKNEQVVNAKKNYGDLTKEIREFPIEPECEFFKTLLQYVLGTCFWSKLDWYNTPFTYILNLAAPKDKDVESMQPHLKGIPTRTREECRKALLNNADGILDCFMTLSETIQDSRADNMLRDVDGAPLVIGILGLVDEHLGNIPVAEDASRLACAWIAILRQEVQNFVEEFKNVVRPETTAVRDKGLDLIDELQDFPNLQNTLKSFHKHADLGEPGLGTAFVTLVDTGKQLPPQLRERIYCYVRRFDLSPGTPKWYEEATIYCHLKYHETFAESGSKQLLMTLWAAGAMAKAEIPYLDIAINLGKRKEVTITFVESWKKGYKQNSGPASKRLRGEGMVNPSQPVEDRAPTSSSDVKPHPGRKKRSRPASRFSYYSETPLVQETTSHRKVEIPHGGSRTSKREESAEAESQIEEKTKKRSRQGGKKPARKKKAHTSKITERIEQTALEETVTPVTTVEAAAESQTTEMALEETVTPVITVESAAESQTTEMASEETVTPAATAKDAAEVLRSMAASNKWGVPESQILMVAAEAILNSDRLPVELLAFSECYDNVEYNKADVERILANIAAITQNLRLKPFAGTFLGELKKYHETKELVYEAGRSVVKSKIGDIRHMLDTSVKNWISMFQAQMGGERKKSLLHYNTVAAFEAAGDPNANIPKTAEAVEQLLQYYPFTDVFPLGVKKENRLDTAKPFSGEYNNVAIPDIVPWLEYADFKSGLDIERLEWLQYRFMELHKFALRGAGVDSACMHLGDLVRGIFDRIKYSDGYAYGNRAGFFTHDTAAMYNHQLSEQWKHTRKCWARAWINFWYLYDAAIVHSPKSRKSKLSTFEVSVIAPPGGKTGSDFVKVVIEKARYYGYAMAIFMMSGYDNESSIAWTANDLVYEIKKRFRY